MNKVDMPRFTTGVPWEPPFLKSLHDISLQLIYRSKELSPIESLLSRVEDLVASLFKSARLELADWRTSDAAYALLEIYHLTEPLDIEILFYESTDYRYAVHLRIDPDQRRCEAFLLRRDKEGQYECFEDDGWKPSSSAFHVIEPYSMAQLMEEARQRDACPDDLFQDLPAPCRERARCLVTALSKHMMSGLTVSEVVQRYGEIIRLYCGTYRACSFLMTDTDVYLVPRTGERHIGIAISGTNGQYMVCRLAGGFHATPVFPLTGPEEAMEYIERYFDKAAPSDCNEVLFTVPLSKDVIFVHYGDSAEAVTALGELSIEYRLKGRTDVASSAEEAIEEFYACSARQLRRGTGV